MTEASSSIHGQCRKCSWLHFLIVAGVLMQVLWFLSSSMFTSARTVKDVDPSANQLVVETTFTLTYLRVHTSFAHVSHSSLLQNLLAAVFNLPYNVYGPLLPPQCAQLHHLPLSNVTDVPPSAPCETQADIRLSIVAMQARKRLSPVSYGTDYRLVLRSRSISNPQHACFGDFYQLTLSVSGVTTNYISYTLESEEQEASELLEGEEPWIQADNVTSESLSLRPNACEGVYTAIFRDVAAGDELKVSITRANRRWKHYMLGMYNQVCGWCKMKSVAFWTAPQQIWDESDCSLGYFPAPHFHEMKNTIYRKENMGVIQIPGVYRESQSLSLQANQTDSTAELTSNPICDGSFRGRWLHSSCLADLTHPCANLKSSDGSSEWVGTDSLYIPYGCQPEFYSKSRIQHFLTDNNIQSIHFFGDSLSMNMHSFFLTISGHDPNQCVYHNVYGLAPLPEPGPERERCGPAMNELYNIKSAWREQRTLENYVKQIRSGTSPMRTADLLVCNFAYAHDENGAFNKSGTYRNMLLFLNTLIEVQFSGRVILVLPIFPNGPANAPTYSLLTALALEVAAEIFSNSSRPFKMQVMDLGSVTRGRGDRFYDGNIHFLPQDSYSIPASAFPMVLGQAITRQLLDVLIHGLLL